MTHYENLEEMWILQSSKKAKKKNKALDGNKCDNKSFSKQSHNKKHALIKAKQCSNKILECDQFFWTDCIFITYIPLEYSLMILSELGSLEVCLFKM